jgi:hypothetical protein
VTDDARALEIANALDELSSSGYPDGQGNRMPGGDSLRTKVRGRQQRRQLLYSGSGVILVVGFVVVLGRVNRGKKRNHG